MDQEQVQKLISELQNGTDRQRRAASYKLRNFKDAAVVHALINAYTDSDISVRHNVIEGLQQIRTKDAQEFLIAQGQSIQVTNSNGKNTVWSFLIPLTTITLGVVLGLAIQYRAFVLNISSDYGSSPPQLIAISGIVFGYGVVGGAIGGIAVGIIRVFGWKISKEARAVVKATFIIFLPVAGLAIVLSLFSSDLPEPVNYLSRFIAGTILFYLLIGWLPTAINFLIVFFITKIVFSQLIKSPVNWGIFVFLLAIGTIIIILVTSFFVSLAGYAWVLFQQ